jgi:transcriptional regulator with XRE-family HTH domain
MSTQAEQALRLIERLIEVAPDANLRLRAVRMRSRLLLPMSEVLSKVPGRTIRERARLVGVTRQAWYQWMDGTARPSAKRAKQLERITGYPADEIRGLNDD